MTNVLPTETLQAELRRFKNRLVLVGALVFFGTALFSALTLIPSHIALLYGYANQEQQSSATLGSIPVANDQQTAERSDVLRAQALLLSAQPFVTATSSPSEAITTALALKPQDVRIDHISFLSAGTGTITISGSSQVRESISKYRNALAQSGRFKTATVPVGALVGTEGGKFTITLTGIL